MRCFVLIMIRVHLISGFPSCPHKGPFENPWASEKTWRTYGSFQCLHQSADELRLNSRSGHIIQTTVALVSPSVSAGDAARCQPPVRNAGNTSCETLTILEDANKKVYCQSVCLWHDEYYECFWWVQKNKETPARCIFLRSTKSEGDEICQEQCHISPQYQKRFE